MSNRWNRSLGRFRLLPRSDSPGSEKHASLENTLVCFKPDTKKCHNIFFQFMTTVRVLWLTIYNIKCANDTIIELHDLHKSFVSSIVFLTEVQHHACALNIPICPTGTTMVSPGDLPGTLQCFRQLPGTPGEANKSAPGKQKQLQYATLPLCQMLYFASASVACSLHLQILHFCLCAISHYMMYLPMWQMLDAESAWHGEKQTDLRRQVQETDGLNVKKYKQVDEVCDFIKKVTVCYYSIQMQDCISYRYQLRCTVKPLIVNTPD